MEEIRVMWCDALEELLQCPVCLEASQGVKVQCVNGHHICSPCRDQLQSCPICKHSFIPTRNFAVEHISAKLEEIKLSLLHPYHALNRRTLHDKICVATQTDNKYYTSSACQTVNEKLNEVKPITPRNEQQRPMINLAPRVGKGSYPCHIGSCVIDLPHERMIGHLRCYHRDVFYEFTAKNNVLKQTWDLEYISNRDYDFAFHIKEMGLFFLNISINKMGDLMASLKMVNCITVCKQFTYTFEVVGEFNTSYTGLVKSCRVLPRQGFSNDGLLIHQNNMRHIINNKNSFHCNLTIKRKIDYRTIDAKNNPTNVDIMNN